MTTTNNSIDIFENFAPNIWIYEYPIDYAGCKFHSRMTIIKLSDEKVLLHSPCEIDDNLKEAIEANIGKVAYIVAPGNFHHLHVPSAQVAFPSATTYICPTIETKRKDLKYDFILNDTKPVEAWSADLEQVLLKGNNVINEVAFLHKSTQTLILVDSIEYIGDDTPGTNWVIRFWWFLLNMWNKPKPAPEYQMGWKCDKSEARESMNKILQWDFDKVIISHGDNITMDAHGMVRQAWQNILESEDVQCFC